jgi:hypothetical protein
MGYSIMTPFETEAEQNQMKTFLQHNGRSLSTILPHLPKDVFSAGCPGTPTDDVSYKGDITEPVLGFDYGAGDGDEIRDYSFLLCYWMAVQAGKRIDGRPYVIYDGCENWTLFAGETPTDAERKAGAIELNDFGYKKTIQALKMERLPAAKQVAWGKIKKQIEETDRDFYTELLRLTQLWKSESRLSKKRLI